MRIFLRQWPGMLGCLAFLLCAAACAPAGGLSGGNVPPTPTPAPGSSRLNGCLTQRPPTGVQERPADVVIGPVGSSVEGMPITLSKGQTLEVRLTATVRWGLSIQDPEHVLTTDKAAGWYDPALKACLWHFTAVGAGSATLAYTGGLVCEPNTPCPAIAMVQQYIVTIW